MVLTFFTMVRKLILNAVWTLVPIGILLLNACNEGGSDVIGASSGETGELEVPDQIEPDSAYSFRTTPDTMGYVDTQLLDVEGFWFRGEYSPYAEYGKGNLVTVDSVFYQCMDSRDCFGLSPREGGAWRAIEDSLLQRQVVQNHRVTARTLSPILTRYQGLWDPKKEYFNHHVVLFEGKFWISLWDSVQTSEMDSSQWVIYEPWANPSIQVAPGIFDLSGKFYNRKDDSLGFLSETIFQMTSLSKEGVPVSIMVNVDTLEVPTLWQENANLFTESATVFLLDSNAANIQGTLGLNGFSLTAKDSLHLSIEGGDLRFFNVTWDPDLDSIVLEIHSGNLSIQGGWNARSRFDLLHHEGTLKLKDVVNKATNASYDASFYLCSQKPEQVTYENAGVTWVYLNLPDSMWLSESNTARIDSTDCLYSDLFIDSSVGVVE